MALRNLLGNAKKIVHDPGPEGESGEGDACLVMIFLVIGSALFIFLYGGSLFFFAKRQKKKKNVSLHPPPLPTHLSLVTHNTPNTKRAGRAHTAFASFVLFDIRPPPRARSTFEVATSLT